MKLTPEQVLERYWDGQLPVDFLGIASRAGIRVRTKVFKDATLVESGICGGEKTIFVQEALAKERGIRFNFAVAHALGHIFMHDLKEIYLDDETNQTTGAETT